MKLKIFVVILLTLVFSRYSFAATWCKAIYQFSAEASDGNFNKQLDLCKNSDNIFISISSKYLNSMQLLHASIANFCDLNRQVIKTQSRKGDDSFHSVACVFKRHKLRKEQ